MARQRRAASSDPLRDDPQIPEDKENESDAWKRAFKYAVSKGNYIRAGEEGDNWNEANRYKGAIVYADAHELDFEHGDTPGAQAEE